MYTYRNKITYKQLYVFVLKDKTKYKNLVLENVCIYCIKQRKNIN